MKKIALLFPWLYISSLLANPSNPTVTHGNATFELNGSQLIIKNEDNTIINWQDFNIGSGEITKFVQSNLQSSVLNRVIGTNSTLIEGLLQSNGKVYLINPQGVLITKTGVIETGGFLASTLDMPDADFLKGESFHFLGESNNSIVNQGTIEVSGGDVTFIAARVDNQGIVKALDGTVSSGVGYDVYFQPDKSQRIYIKKSLNVEESEKQVEGYSNSGIIESIQNHVDVDGNLYHLAINLKGEDIVHNSQDLDGLILFTSEEGRIECTGATLTASDESDMGGSVHLLASKVDLFDTKIDVSAPLGGGLVEIGKDSQKQFGIRDSKKSWIDSKSVILADATKKGNGGTIYTWGDDYDCYQGKTSARGGPEGGNGGFLEISSNFHPIISGSADMRAPLGEMGEVYIDPTNVTISGDSSSNYTTKTSSDGTILEFSSYSSSNVNLIDLNALLSTSNVTIDTAQSTGSAVGNIIVNDSVTFNSPSSSTLTLKANYAISFNASLVNPGKVIIESGGGGVNFSPTTVPTGNLCGVQSSASTLTITTPGPINVNPLVACDVSVGSSTSQVDIECSGININLEDPGSGTVLFTAGGDLNINPPSLANLGISCVTESPINSPITFESTGGNLRMGSTIPFSGISLLGYTANVTLSAASDLTVKSSDTLSLLAQGSTASLIGGTGGGSSTVTLEAAGVISTTIASSQTGIISISNEGTGNIKLNASSIGLNGGNDAESDVTLTTSNGAIYIVGNTTLTGGFGSPNGGDAYIVASNGLVDIQGALTLAAGTGDAYINTTSVNSGITVDGGSVSLSSGSGGGLAFISTSESNSPILINGTGTCSVNGNASGPGNSYISTSGSGSISIHKTQNIEVNASGAGAAYIKSTGGYIDITTFEDVVVRGGSGSSDSEGYIKAVDGSLTMVARNYFLQPGNSGSGNHDASFTTEGDNKAISIKGVMVYLSGSSGDKGAAYIQTTGENAHITFNTGLKAIAGTGEDSTAEVVTNGASNITFTHNSAIDQDIILSGGNGDFAYSSISSVGGGNIDIDVAGQVVLTGGLGGGANDAFITTNGDCSIKAVGDITLQGGGGANSSQAYISTTENSNDLTLTADHVNVKGGSGASSNAYIKTEDMGSDININGGLILNGGSGASSFAVVTTEMGGDIVIEGIGLLQPIEFTSGSGTTSYAGVYSQVSGNVQVIAGGDLNFGSSATTSGQRTFITSEGALSIGSNQGDITLSFYSPFDEISSNDNFVVNAKNGNISMSGVTSLKINDGGTGYMFLSAGVSIIMRDTTNLQTPSGVPITLVTDALYPIPYEFGSGGFIQDSNAYITTPSNRLKIYTSIFENNDIQGLLNGDRFQGQKNVQDAHNIEFVYYPRGLIYNPPYTVYYKTSSIVIQGAFNELNSSVSQLFFQLDQAPNSYQDMSMWYSFNYRSAVSTRDIERVGDFNIVLKEDDYEELDNFVHSYPL
ncbi:MAG: filamentous hemagglutinin N-terminal domain-containing protein [Rhabdochlamydiaceae bacterium]|nr:filamentous hemagglutinin N-terminal domain-containing protein [Candidatus Amphrikana amoebophyrae]